jgi:hypothetical protein
MAEPAARPKPDEQAKVTAVLTAEYSVLTAALTAAWSASLTRTSLFLVVLSASGVALGFAAPAGGENLRVHALIALPLLLFLGMTTFVRVVQLQRESAVYITGQNRIRRFFADSVPAARPYFVLPLHDDRAALFRSPGTGMSRRPPRFPILNLIVQMQGLVGVVTASVAAVFGGIAFLPFGLTAGWLGAAAGFVAMIVALFAYWRRSLNELWSSLESRYPTPPDEVDAPF